MYHLKKEKINLEHLKEACQNTFKHRNTDFNVDSILDTLSILKLEKDLKIRWKSYQKRFSYAEEVSFDELIDTVIKVVKNFTINAV